MKNGKRINKKNKRFKNWDSLFLILIVFNTSVSGQSLPSWFVHPQELKSRCSIGIVQTSFFKDSSYFYAFKKACENAIMQKECKVLVRTSFLGTTDKTYWEDYFEKIEFDTSILQDSYTRFKIVDSIQTENITIALIAEKKNININRNLINIENEQKPEWIKNIPQLNGFFYSVGQSEDYYFTTSSWDIAEKSAILGLARRKFQYIKSDYTREQSNFLDNVVDLRKEIVFAHLKNIEILSRWYDIKNKIYYVLARCDKN